MARRYKVLHVTNFLDMSGQQENTLYTVTGLNQERFEGHLAANLWGGDRQVDNVLARRAQTIPHLTLHDLPHLRFAVHPVYDGWALLDLVRLMRRERFDIVHTHANKVGLIGRMAAKISGVPIIIHGIHGWSFKYDLVPRVVTGAFLAMEKFVDRYTDFYVSVDEACVRDGLANGLGSPSQYKVVRSGMDLNHFLNATIDRPALLEELGIPADRQIVGTVMLFYRRKAPEIMVQMAPQVLQAVPDTHFLIVGDGEMMPVVKNTVASLGLEDRVTVTGLRPDPERMMALMDVFAHPALIDMLPRVIVQAMATGTPVVSTEVGGVPEVIDEGRTGFLVPPGDVQALAACVIRLLKDAGLRESVGKRARTFIAGSEFTIDAMVKSNESVYNHLIALKLGDPTPIEHGGTV